MECCVFLAEWRRGVGRQARQSGGGILSNNKALSFCDFGQRVQVRRTPVVPVFLSGRGLSDGALFDSPESGAWISVLIPRGADPSYVVAGIAWITVCQRRRFQE